MLLCALDEHNIVAVVSDHDDGGGKVIFFIHNIILLALTIHHSKIVLLPVHVFPLMCVAWSSGNKVNAIYWYRF